MEFLTAEWGVDNEHYWFSSATSGGHDTLGLSSHGSVGRGASPTGRGRGGVGVG